MSFDPDDYIRRVRRVLHKTGDLYDLEDIKGCIADGSMQSIVNGDNWVVTRILEFPRKKVLEIILAVGTYKGIAAMEPAVLSLAAEYNCKALMSSYSRLGWRRVMTKGWRMTSANYMRDL